LTKFERLFYTFPPVAFLIRKSKVIILPGFKGVPLYDVVQFFFKQINTVGLNERAAAISFNFLTAIPAATIFLCTLIPYLPFVSKEVTRQLLLFTSDLTPNRNTYLLVKDFLEDFLYKPRNSLLSVGFLVAVYYASNAMMGVIRTFDKSLHDKHKTNFFKKRWRAIRLTTIIVLLLLGVTLLLAGQGALLKWIIRHWHLREYRNLIYTIRWIPIIALFFYAIAMIYKYAPTIKIRWPLNTPGALLATTLMVLATWVFSIWVNDFSSYNKVYGSIGTILILMLLVYFNSLILLIGFELNVSINYLKAKADERKLKEANGLDKAAEIDNFKVENQ